MSYLEYFQARSLTYQLKYISPPPIGFLIKFIFFVSIFIEIRCTSIHFMKNKMSFLYK